MKSDQRVWHWRTYVIKYAPSNSTYRHVLLTLSLYMDEVGGSCFPSVETLCKDTALAKPTVIKYLHQAKDDGWLNIAQHGYRGQRWKRNEYTASIPQKVVKEINHEGGKGGKPDKKGGKPDRAKAVNEVNSNTSENPPDNSPEKPIGKIGQPEISDWEPPTLQEVLNYAESNAIPKSSAEFYYDVRMSQSFMKETKNGNMIPIQRWQYDLNAANRNGWIHKTGNESDKNSNFVTAPEDAK